MNTLALTLLRELDAYLAALPAAPACASELRAIEPAWPLRSAAAELPPPARRGRATRPLRAVHHGR